MNVEVFNSRVNKTRFIIQYELCVCKCGLNESVCNSKQKWNPDECWRKCRELDDWGSCKDIYMWNPITCGCECNKACKIDEYLDTKNCSCKKYVISKLVLECEDEKLNTTETSPDDKKITCGKSNCLIHTISLLIKCLLLSAVISTGCYYYYARDWIKIEYALSFLLS